MSSYSHLQRVPQSKLEYKEISEAWHRESSKAGEAKRRANVNGTGSEVQPYKDKMDEIERAISAWYEKADAVYSSLPER